MCRATACAAGGLRTRTSGRAEIGTDLLQFRGWGAGIRTPAWTSKASRADQLHHPPTGRRPCRYYDASVPAPTVVILAAGEGTRMRSALPKVLHPILGRPMILWPVLAAQQAGAGQIVVIDGPNRALDGVLPDEIEVAVQHEPKGTGDAVKAAAPLIDPDAPVVVINGDVPLITAETIAGLIAGHEAAGAAATMATMELDDPAGYGRVMRAGDGSVERVVETKDPADATAAELAIREVNTGVYAFAGGELLDALEHLRADNAQGELFLPDVLPLLRENGRAIAAHPVSDPTVALGVNDRRQLAQVAVLARARINDAHMLAGVTIVDPQTA